jgi:hypothetical protein
MLIFERVPKSRVMVSKKGNLMIAGAAVAVLALVLASALANGYLASAKSGAAKQNEGVGIQGAVTIALIGPSGQTLSVWKTHNSLVTTGTSIVAMCLESGLECPGAGVYTSVTAVMGIATGSCTNAYSSCGIFAPTTVTLTGCPGSPPPLTCTGWIASATYSPSALGCSSTCTVNDVAAGMTTPSTTGYQFDDIPSSNFPSPISISSGDSLAINIQFTVS